MENKLTKILIASLSLSAIILIIVWLNYDPTKDLSINSPGLDSVGIGYKIEEQEINIGEFYKEFQAESIQMSESWPRFRGADFDNISKSEIKLISEFPENGPNKLWSHSLGEGHAGAAIYKGLVYILDYNEDEKADMLRCFNLKTGEEIWRRWYNVRIKRNHGISRTVPAVTEDYILTIGPRCHVMCTKRENGDFVWGIDIEKDFNSESPLWYTGQCPLIYGNEAIIATGGDYLMIGVDLESGNVNWKVPNKDSIKMSHSSIMPFDFNGSKMFVYAGIGAVVGISAEENNKGQILWTEKRWNHSVVAPSPLCMPDGKIFLSAGYGAGSMLLQLNENNGKFSTEVLHEYKPAKGLASEQQTPLFYKNKIFGILPKDAASFRNQFVCAEPDNPQNFVWTSGKTNRFGLGPYMIADGKFYFLDDDGTLIIAEASNQAYNELDRFKVLNGHDAWAPIAIANGFMVIRDSKTMICLDLNIDSYE